MSRIFGYPEFFGCPEFFGVSGIFWGVRNFLVVRVWVCSCVHVAYVCLCSCCIYVRVVYMLLTCAYVDVAYTYACVDVAYTCACVDVAYVRLCSCWLRAVCLYSCCIYMRLCSCYIRALVFMLLTCACVHVAYTCACVHVAYTCACVHDIAGPAADTFHRKPIECFRRHFMTTRLSNLQLKHLTVNIPFEGQVLFSRIQIEVSKIQRR